MWSGALLVKHGGPYTLQIESEDGSNLFIANSLLVNNDGLHGMRRKQANNKQLASGLHAVRLDFFENGGGAGMIFRYKGPDTAMRMKIVPETNLKPSAPMGAMSAKAKLGVKEEVYYFNQGRRLKNLVTRTPNLVRNVENINYASTGRAWDGLKVKDNFAVRWTGSMDLAKSGRYTMSLTSDDGSKLYIDRSMLISNDGLHGMRQRRGSRTLGAGPHLFRVEFFERGGGAGCIFKYQGPDTGNSMVVVPGRIIQHSRTVASGLKEEVFYFRQGWKLPNLAGKRPTWSGQSRESITLQQVAIGQA